MNPAETVEDLVRPLAPQVLGTLVRRYGHFDASEEATQDALFAASVQWPEQGVPDNPRAWLTTVATRRLTDQLRSDDARRRREVTSTALDPARRHPTDPAVDEDDSLALVFLCCHPVLSPASQVALTLRAVGGLTTSEIAHAFLVPEATMAQRISRAKQSIKTAGARFELQHNPADRADRLRVVLHVLYLIFNEGYTASAGDELSRGDLTADAIRLTRAVHDRLPDEPEVAGLLALMLLTEARRPARPGAGGALIPIDEQDRTQWRADLIDAGIDLITRTLPAGPVGPYQVQAAIAAVHDEAASADDTDWPQILALYGVLERIAPNPMVTLNRVVAVAMVHGPRAGLDLLATLEADHCIATHHRAHAVRAHLLERDGDDAAARDAYRTAARLTTSRPEQRYLEARANRLKPGRPD